MRRFALFFLPWLLLACSSGAAQKPVVKPGTYDKTIAEGKLSRTYKLVVPKGYDGRHALPLVILLHGWTSNADQILAITKFGDKADKESFFLAVPNGTPGIGQTKGWNVGFLDLGAAGVDDVTFVNDILDACERDLMVDSKRIYVTGHSNGAMLAHRIGAELGKRIAAIAPVSGSVGMGQTLIGKPVAPVSVLIIHGDQDETVAYDEKAKAFLMSISAEKSAKFWADANSCTSAVQSRFGKNQLERWIGGKGDTQVEFITVAGGHHAWPTDPFNATDAIWDFFRMHPKP
jgi:polyhydroxybutyrate depolymerase